MNSELEAHDIGPKVGLVAPKSLNKKDYRLCPK
jgi:hypothetical protein